MDETNEDFAQIRFDIYIAHWCCETTFFYHLSYYGKNDHVNNITM